MREHCSLPERIAERQRLCLNRVDVRFSRTVLCSRCHRFPCEWKVNECVEMSSKTLGRHFRDVDNKPRTMMAYGQLELLKPSSQEQVVVVTVVRPKNVVSYSLIQE